jgi:hypothetical protein
VKIEHKALLATAMLSPNEQSNGHVRRPALRPVEALKLPPGRKILPWGWWARDQFEPGSTLLWREQVAKRRAHLRTVGKLKHNPDRRMMKELRRRVEADWLNYHLARDMDLARKFDERFRQSFATH